MDKTIRRNEVCVIGLPRCDYVFSSTRTCFIAYGFEQSTLEMTILKSQLEKCGIQPVEAGGMIAPAQSAFCAKICSKIITSQFCIVLLNNDDSNGAEIPNANVNMEYGLMLGFNKYIIPFQRASQKLPFNVAGLDTIKYTNRNFEQLAKDVIEQAILETQQDDSSAPAPDQFLEVFLLSQRALVTPMHNAGEKDIYQLGAPLGFNLLNDFTGLRYMFLGNFGALRPEVVVWRVKILTEILDGRWQAIVPRVEAGMATAQQGALANEILETLEIWIIVTSGEEKGKIKKALNSSQYNIRVFSGSDIDIELESLTPDIT